MQQHTTVLITGAAGFIGFHLSQQLCLEGITVVGVDNLNDYYDVSLKTARLEILRQNPNFHFHQQSISDYETLNALFNQYHIDYVVNLAAQAGVRYSLVNPFTYVESNMVGFINILECCRHHKVKHLIYASSSSVYGANKKMPFSTADNVDHPLSLYAATKKSNELMAHTYSSLYDLPTTGLRFFTVYGPFGRPDMALFLFTKAIIEGQPIEVYNHGKMKRDFTYVDDVVQSISRLLNTIPVPDPKWSAVKPDPSTSFAPYRVFNIGNNNPVELSRFIEIIEEKLGRKAVKTFLPIQPGDVPETYADINALQETVNFKPSTPIDVGIGKFTAWYKKFYNVNG